MAKKVFVDTWAWLMIADKRESKHALVLNTYNLLRKQGYIFVTTDYVLVETITFFYSRLPLALAKQTVAFIEETISIQYLQVIWMTPDRFDRTKNLRLKYADKPRISFTDLSSMAVMQEQNISTILTGDDHFNQVGLGITVAP